MKIGIIAAMEEELLPLKDKIKHSKLDTIAEKHFWTGALDKRHELVLVQSSVGKVNAAIATTLLNEHYKPDYVINIGSIGSCSPDLKVGDIVISSAVRYHDVDLTMFGYELGQMSKLPPIFIADSKLIKLAENSVKELLHLKAKKALILSGDSFLTTCEKVNFFTEKFAEICAAEMEAAAIAHTCLLFQIPFVIVRAVSDIVGQDNKAVHEEFLDLASSNVAEVILEMVKKL